MEIVVTAHMGCACSSTGFKLKINENVLRGLSEEGRNKYIEDMVKEAILKHIDYDWNIEN